MSWILLLLILLLLGGWGLVGFTLKALIYILLFILLIGAIGAFMGSRGDL